MGDEPIEVAPDSQQIIVQEGNTMSVTVGMGGYDGACNGKYATASWMHTCVASWDQHRGAVIAEFDDKDPNRGTFRYLNSLADGSVVDQFELISRLPGSFSNEEVPALSPTDTDPQQVNPEANQPEIDQQLPVEVGGGQSTSSTVENDMYVPGGAVGPREEKEDEGDENISKSNSTSTTATKTTTSSSSSSFSPFLTRNAFVIPTASALGVIAASTVM